MRFKKVKLRDISTYVSERIETEKVNLDNYISTENLIANKGGKRRAAKLPSSQTVIRYKPKDILISNIRPYFKKIWFSNKSGGSSADVLVIRANERVVPKYLYYFLSQDKIFDYMVQTSKGTKMPRGDKQALMKYELIIPSLKEQKKVSSFLFNIDKKIELNNSIISNLEELAQTLFKHWFVDFEFPNEEGKPYKSSGGKMAESELGMIPEGWRVKELNDISKEIICGKTPRTSVNEYYGGNLPFITIPDMHNQVFALNTARYLTKEGEKSQIKKTLPPKSICVSCIATPGLVVLTCVPSQTNQQINSIIPKEEDTYFLYLSLTDMSNLIKELGSGGSTTLNLNRTQFSKIKISYPTKDIRRKFNEKIESLFLKILCLQKENDSLKNLRDSLLPKLLSGEIELPDDMEVMEDVPVP